MPSLLALAILPLLPLLQSPAPVDDLALTPLFASSNAATSARWRPVHDRVMGGVSTGEPRTADGALVLAGEVSLEQGGGFASFRTDDLAPELDLAAHDGLRLRVRGDGATWKLSLRTRGAREDLNWQACFATTEGAWTKVLVPFDAFLPSYHGRFVASAEPLERGAITGLGLLIADKQEGAFELAVDTIDAWRAPVEQGTEPAPGTLAAQRARTVALQALLDDADEPERAARALLDALTGSERVLVVSEPLAGGDLGADASIQIGRFYALTKELAARDLRIVHLLGERGARVAGRTLAPDAANVLREAWDLPADAWATALVGKDGGVKERWSAPFAPNEAFELIDAMPMRR